MKREDVLREAERCVCGQREQDYGSPEDNFGTIARLWTVYTGRTITPVDVAMMMALLKIARIGKGKTKDSFVDLAGYAACGGELASIYYDDPNPQPVPEKKIGGGDEEKARPEGEGKNGDRQGQGQSPCKSRLVTSEDCGRNGSICCKDQSGFEGALREGGRK